MHPRIEAGDYPLWVSWYYRLDSSRLYATGFRRARGVIDVQKNVFSSSAVPGPNIEKKGTLIQVSANGFMYPRYMSRSSTQNSERVSALRQTMASNRMIMIQTIGTGRPSYIR